LVWSGSHDLFGWFQVYDVTKFLEDHPGGEDVLLHASGKLRLLLHRFPHLW
jgi:cytochrome b involved in lipid metabolism